MKANSKGSLSALKTTGISNIILMIEFETTSFSDCYMVDINCMSSV